MFAPICRDFLALDSRPLVEGGVGRRVRDADDVVRTGEAERRQLGLQLAPDPGRRAGVGEERGADGDVARAGRQQLERVPAAGDSAHADDRQARLAEAGVDGRERDRPQRRTREPARPAREHRLQRPLVQREALDRVDEAEAVGARRLRGPRGRAEIGDRGRELRVQRLVGDRPHGRDHLADVLGHLVDVRAGEVQLERLDLVARADPLGDVHVVLEREAADGDPERHAELGEPRQVLGEEARRSRGSRGRSRSASRARSRRSAPARCPRAAAA